MQYGNDQYLIFILSLIQICYTTIFYKSMESEERPKRTFLIAFLYFLQGLNNAVSGTIILTYSLIPSYSVLTIFQLASLPYSFKFLIAPIQERYTSNSYGRRKTWILACTFGMTVFAFIMSRFTDQKYAIVIGLISIPQVMMGTCQDVALDALALKEIQQPDKISLIQMMNLTIGNVFGSFFFLKLVSADFAHKIGLSSRIMEVSSYFLFLGVMFLIAGVYLHFTYKQPRLQSQQHDQDNKQSIIDTLKRYKAFIDPDRRQCRLAIYFALIVQGMHFFSKTYLTQMMKQGFSKERLNELSTACLIPVIAISYFYGKVNFDNAWRKLKIVILLKYFVCIFVFFYHSTSYWFIIVYIFFNDIMISFKMFLECTIINSFPLNKYSAMTIAMSNSSRNFGTSSVIQFWTVGKMGFRAASIMGFIIQGLVFSCLNKFVTWVQEGQVDEGVNLEGEDQPVQ